jgi:predicted ABC-type ATPase
MTTALIKRPRKSKPFTMPASVPGTKYVSDPSLPACETDAEGLKGQTFLNFVYNQLKKGTGEASPTVYIMMGPPGAGKSTIKKTFNINNYVNIDLDEIKKICVRCFPDSPSIKGVSIIGNLKRFAKQLTEMAIAERINILFDTTGRMKDVVENVINETKSADYKQIFIIVYTSLDNCLERVAMRNVTERDREPMRSSVVEDAYNGFMETSASGIASYYLIANSHLTDEANELYVFDNNGSSPQLLFKRVDGNIEVANEAPNFYNMSINSSEPYFTVNRRGGRKTRRKYRRRQRGHKKSRRY